MNFFSTFSKIDRRRLIGLSIFLAAFMVLPVSAARAEGFPRKAISITVGSAPGSIDTLVRMLTDSMTATLGQPVIVNNRPGANGTLAADTVRRSLPDGYNVLFATNSTMVLNPLVYKAATYSALNDFEPIAQHAQMPMVWIANKQTDFHTLEDVINFAKKNPGALKAANHGPGGGAALYENLLSKQYGLDINQVPHPSASQSILRLMAGDVHVGVETLSTIMPRVANGEVRPLAVTGPSRVKTLPQVPSWTETTMPARYGSLSWYGFFAPKGTPSDVVAKLNAAINKALQEPRVQEHASTTGGVIVLQSADDFRSFVRKETDFYQGIVKSLGMSPS